VTALEFSPDGNLLASSSNATDPITGKLQPLALWNAADGSLVRRFQGHTSLVVSLAFSPDGKYLASAGSAKGDAVIRIWDSSSGKQVNQFAHDGVFVRIAYSPDGKYLAAHTDARLMVWDATGNKLLYQQDIPSSQAHLAFSPDSQYLLVEDGTSIRLLKPATGDMTYIFKATEPESMAYFPDGQMLAMGLANGTIQIWRSTDWKLALTLAGVKDAVVGVAFSPDGRFLASASLDGTIRLWGVR
jgi:WD40 repeat protein